MKLGLGSYAFAWAAGVPGHMPAHPLTATGLVQRAASLGLTLVQIADNIPLHECSRDELAELQATAAGSGVNIEVGTRGIARSHILRYLDLCRYFSSPILRVVVDTATDHPSPDEVIAFLTNLTPDLKSAGVTLAIENHDRFDAPTFVRLVTAVADAPVGICLDTVNSFGALEGPAVVIETLAPYVVNLHLKDFVIHRLSHMMGFEITGAPAGQGRLDIPSLLATLEAHGRDPNAIIELWPSPENSIEETIAKEGRWADESVGYLRTLIPQ